MTGTRLTHVARPGPIVIRRIHQEPDGRTRKTIARTVAVRLLKSTAEDLVLAAAVATESAARDRLNSPPPPPIFPAHTHI